MSTKIRLARRGRKQLAIFDIVVADTRSPRDGRFIEKLGIYNPNTTPSTVVLNEERALDWVLKGAEPSETARGILSTSGIMLRKHLQVGVNKGAITQEAADAKFKAWKDAKDKLESDRKSAVQKEKDAKAKKDAEERAKLRAEAEAKAAKKAEEAVAASLAASAPEAAAEEVVTETPAVEEAAPEVVAEAPEVEEAPAAAEPEAPVAETPAE